MNEKNSFLIIIFFISFFIGKHLIVSFSENKTNKNLEKDIKETSQIFDNAKYKHPDELETTAIRLEIEKK